MARKTIYGKYILSAGEIASYTVCPEAWRLNLQPDVTPIRTKSVDEGHRLHEEWMKSLDNAMFFTRGVRLIVLLIVLSIVFFLIRFLHV